MLGEGEEQRTTIYIEFFFLIAVDHRFQVTIWETSEYLIKERHIYQNDSMKNDRCVGI